MIITAWSGVLPKGKIQAGAARAFDMAGTTSFRGIVEAADVDYPKNGSGERPNPI